MNMTIECVACEEEAVGRWKNSNWNLCADHLMDVSDRELVDEFARQLYIEDYLIPEKKKRSGNRVSS